MPEKDQIKEIAPELAHFFLSSHSIQVPWFKPLKSSSQVSITETRKLPLKVGLSTTFRAYRIQHFVSLVVQECPIFPIYKRARLLEHTVRSFRAFIWIEGQRKGSKSGLFSLNEYELGYFEGKILLFIQDILIKI